MNCDAEDRRERTIYVGGMHPKVTEELLYDTFVQVGPVEKVILHENPDETPHHALIIFKNVDSVMISLTLLAGAKFYDRPLQLRPLRESTHAAVLGVINRGQNASPTSYGGGGGGGGARYGGGGAYPPSPVSPLRESNQAAVLGPGPSYSPSPPPAYGGSGGRYSGGGGGGANAFFPFV